MVALYRPVRAADRRSIGSTPSYARRSRWPCYGSISGITATSLGGLSYKIPERRLPSHAPPTRRLPLPPPPCARVSSSLHRRSASPTHPLGPVAPPQASPFHLCALPSPEPDPPRPPAPAIAQRPRRRLLRPTTCRMDLPGPTTSVGTRTDYSVGPWDYSTCAARHMLA
jgi:hypothetical protein